MGLFWPSSLPPRQSTSRGCSPSLSLSPSATPWRSSAVQPKSEVLSWIAQTLSTSSPASRTSSGTPTAGTVCVMSCSTLASISADQIILISSHPLSHPHPYLTSLFHFLTHA